MSDNVIEAVRATKIFRDFWMREKVVAVNDLDLNVHGHEVFGLLGPNGSGKSTTLKMILGLLFPTRGRITIFGKLPTDVAVKARVGFLPEESYLYPFLDAHETLDFYGRLFHQNRTERRRRIDMLLEMVGLTSVAFRRVGEYSKGMQRRIGLAQALINDPELLILDEPTSGMDPIGTREFKDLIRTLASRGKTILLSSHLLADVEDVCDRVCILYGGKTRAAGTVDDLLAQHGQVQLTLDDLDEATLGRVRAVLQQAGKTVRNITQPRDRLEDLFLRVVREAQEQHVSTGGAMAGGEVAAFLRGEDADGHEVIEQLVQTAQESVDVSAQDSAPQEPVATPVTAQAARQVLAELVQAPRASTGESPKAAPPSPLPQKQADRAVLDELLGSNEDKEQ